MVPIGESVNVTPTLSHTLTSKDPNKREGRGRGGSTTSLTPSPCKSSRPKPQPQPSPPSKGIPVPVPTFLASFSHPSTGGQPLVIDASKIEVESCTPTITRSLSKDGMEANVVPFLQSSLGKPLILLYINIYT